MFINLTQKEFYEIEDDLFTDGKSAVVLFSSNKNHESDEIVNRLMTLSNNVSVPIYNLDINEAEGLAATYSVYEENVPCIVIFDDCDYELKFDKNSNINDIVNFINSL